MPLHENLRFKVREEVSIKDFDVSIKDLDVFQSKDEEILFNNFVNVNKS